MKAVNVDDVLKILYKYGRFLFVTDEKKYTNMMDEIANLKELKQEPKTGHWRAVYQGDEIINYRCSECELGDTNGSTNLYGWDYCRRCGAKMESEEV